MYGFMAKFEFDGFESKTISSATLLTLQKIFESSYIGTWLT